MAKVLILQNAPLFTAGSFEKEMEQEGITYEYHKVFELGAPSHEMADQYAGFIILGGPLNFRVDQVERSPNLTKIVSFLRVCLEKHKPIIAISQGANLLAHAQGAWVARAPQKEIGWIKAEIYPDYSRNSVIFSKIDQKKFPAFVWYDTFHGFPPTGYWYVNSPNCRYLSTGIHGNCYLFNFHPEITEELLNLWLREYASELVHKEDLEKLREQTKEHLAFSHEISAKIIHAFASFLR